MYNTMEKFDTILVNYKNRIADLQYLCITILQRYIFFNIRQHSVYYCHDNLLFQVKMWNLKRKRVDAPHVPTLEDMHPYTTWSMCVRVYHKFHVERFAVGRKRLSMVLLDEKVILTRTFVVNNIIASTELSLSIQYKF